MNKELLNNLITLILLTIILAIILFLLHDKYSTLKEKVNKREVDDLLKEELCVEYKTFNDKRKRVYRHTSNQCINVTLDMSNLYTNPLDNSDEIKVKQYKLKEVIKKKKKDSKAKKTFKIIMDVFFIILIVFIAGFNIYNKVNNNLIVINNTSYVTLASGSMSYKNEANTYLKENKLDNQLKTFSLIGLNKIEDATKEVKLYDICAYISKKTNKLTIHRVIDIEVRSDGITYYTFRGDANSSSDYYLVKDTEILYKYNDYVSYPLGLLVSFINSYVGLFVIIYIFISIYYINRTYHKMDELVLNKAKECLNEFNEEEIKKLGDTRYINY